METGGCRNDGNEPSYFRLYEGYLFSSIEECCENYYDWSITECLDPSDHDPCYSFMGIYDEDFRVDSERGYYPVCEYQVL